MNYFVLRTSTPKDKKPNNNYTKKLASPKSSHFYFFAVI